MNQKPIIEIRDMHVTYALGHKQEVRALQNIQLQIFPGEFIIFFGPSGCGKSTLLYSIAGLETHARGTILVNGKNVADMTTHEAGQFRQKKIGMIFQAFYLISTLNVLDNVCLPQMAIGVPPVTRVPRAKELLEHFGVGTQATKKPTELSGGQQQRVAICRALMNDPDILLADEPVGNLDSKSSTDVIQLIRELNEKQKKTVILVTHDPSHLHLAHRVFYMRDGTIIDVKVNKAISEEVKAASLSSTPNVPKDLELLLRTFTALGPGQVGTLLVPFKAKEIVAEALSGLSLEELTSIEHEVQRFFTDPATTPYELKEVLTSSAKQGGFGLDHRTAIKIQERIMDVIQELRELHPPHQDPVPLSEELRDLRHDLVETFSLHFRDDEHLALFDQAIHRRVQGEIDGSAFIQALLHRGVGHIGMDGRLAKKVGRRLELLLLGNFES